MRRYTCSVCHVQGHNGRSCAWRGGSIAPPPAPPRVLQVEDVDVFKNKHGWYRRVVDVCLGPFRSMGEALGAEA